MDNLYKNGEYGRWTNKLLSAPQKIGITGFCFGQLFGKETKRTLMVS
jgi:hypothetical protein